MSKGCYQGRVLMLKAKSGPEWLSPPMAKSLWKHLASPSLEHKKNFKGDAAPREGVPTPQIFSLPWPRILVKYVKNNIFRLAATDVPQTPKLDSDHA